MGSHFVTPGPFSNEEGPRLKVLLTGATGFLGKAVLAELLQSKFGVVVLHRETSDISGILSRFANLELFDSKDQGLESAFAAHPDIFAVLHMATDYGRKAAKPSRTFWSNEAFPMRVMETALESGTRVFLNMDTFFSTNTEYPHLKDYALSKRHFLEWGQYLAGVSDIKFVNVRLFHLYGPGDSDEKFVPSMIRRCLNGESIDLSAGGQRRDFIHIVDTVSAIMAVLKASTTLVKGFHHFEVGGGRSISIRDFMEQVKILTGGKATLNFGALPVRQGEFEESHADLTALGLLGWKPSVGISQGIDSIVSALKCSESSNS